MLPNRDSSALFGPALAKNKGRCQHRAESGGWQRTKGIFKTAIPLEIPPTAGCQELTAVLSSLEATHYHAWQDNGMILHSHPMPMQVLRYCTPEQAWESPID